MKNSNWQKNTKDQYNTRPQPKFDDTQTKFLTGKTIAVWNDDVGGALRKLKKVLENDNQQKDLARHEYHEKESTRRNRAKDAAKSRWKKEISDKRANRTWIDPVSLNLDWMRTKKKRRRHTDLQKKIIRTRE